MKHMFSEGRFRLIAAAALIVGMAACDGRPEPTQPPDPPSAAGAGRERMHRDSITGARAAEERRLAAEREAAERVRARRAAAERLILEEMIFFDYDQAAIREDAELALRAKVEILLARPAVQLRIDAHADERGGPEYNLRLSEARGEAVVAFFVAAGVGASRLTVVSHGEEQPLVQGTGEEAWARNRRVQFVITAGVDDLGR